MTLLSLKDYFDSIKPFFTWKSIKEGYFRLMFLKNLMTLTSFFYFLVCLFSWDLDFPSSIHKRKFLGISVSRPESCTSHFFVVPASFDNFQINEHLYIKFFI